MPRHPMDVKNYPVEDMEDQGQIALRMHCMACGRDTLHLWSTTDASKGLHMEIFCADPDCVASREHWLREHQA